MRRKIIKRSLVILVGTFLLFAVVLGIHIYIVTRPKAPDVHTRIMARLDLKQPIGSVDSAKITAWMYQQIGIDHVVCSPSARLVVFTFLPIKTSANRVAADLNAQLPYQATRFLPSDSAMQGGCPIASTSFSYKMFQFIKHIF